MQGRRMLGAGQGWSGHAARSQGLCSDSRSHATSHHSRGGCRGVVPRHAGVQHRLSFHFGATVQQPHVCVDRHRWFEGYPLYHTTCLPRWRMTHHSAAYGNFSHCSNARFPFEGQTPAVGQQVRRRGYEADGGRTEVLMAQPFHWHATSDLRALDAYPN